MTSDELRVTSEEETGRLGDWEIGGRKLSPAMERWRKRLAGGYTIRPRLRRGRKGQAYLEWGPALFNPEGGFVQNVRRDTLRKMMRLGILGEDGRAAVPGMDVNDGADDGRPRAADDGRGATDDGRVGARGRVGGDSG